MQFTVAQVAEASVRACGRPEAPVQTSSLQAGARGALAHSDPPTSSWLLGLQVATKVS